MSKDFRGAKAGMMQFAGKTVRSMPERFEIYIVCKWRYINTLSFPFHTTWRPEQLA